MSFLVNTHNEYVKSIRIIYNTRKVNNSFISVLLLRQYPVFNKLFNENLSIFFLGSFFILNLKTKLSLS